MSTSGGRPRAYDDTPLASVVIEYYNLGFPVNEIVDQLHNQGYQVSKRTVERRLQEAGLRRKPAFNHTEILHVIDVMFFQLSYDDDAIADALLQQKGVAVSARTIQRIRLNNNLQRRHVTEEKRAEIVQRAASFLLQDDLESGTVRGFGASLLYTYLRTKANIVIGRNLLYQVYRSHPEFNTYAEERSLASRVHTRNFVVPGPNFMWSLDGYEKLRKIGFSIYGCIDAYSRALIWVWVGRASITALSTLKQFLRTVHQNRVRPYLTRSDHGSETPLWVGLQATLAGIERTSTADVTGAGEGVAHDQGDLLTSCHIYGPSTANQRIESWWSIFMRCCTKRWIEFATFLIDTALFIPGDLADQIAVYAIYGGMIRAEVADFMLVWNGHRIRKQANRPHLRTGIPAQMLHDPNIRNFGVRLGDTAVEAMEQMMEAIQDVEVDLLLDEETDGWCVTQLREMGFDGELHGIEGHKYPHLETYMALKGRIERHIESGAIPRLKVADTPTGGTKRFIDLLRKNSGVVSEEGTPLTGNPVPDFIVDAINTAEAYQTEKARMNAERIVAGEI